MADEPARDSRLEQPAHAHARRMSVWAAGTLAAVVGPALLLAAGIGALAGIRPATSAPAAAVTLDSEEQQFLKLINDYRGAQGLATLSIDPQLEAASRWMSTDMATNGYFSHYDSLGRDPFQRMAAFGYDYNVWKGENLAAGTASAQVAFDLWKASPGHNSNMTNPDFVVIGIARAHGPNSGLNWYWTTDFGGLANAEPPANPTASPTPAAPSVTPTPPSTPSPRPTAAPTPTPTRSAPPTATATATPAPAGNGFGAIQGALDCNAAIGARDALFVLRIVAGVPADVCPSASADVNCNGSIDTTDAVDPLLYMAHRRSAAAVDCPKVGAPAA